MWDCLWERGNPPHLTRIDVRSFTESTGQGPHRTLFADCTASVFRDDPYYDAQILPGIDDWRARIQAQYSVSPDGHHGIAIGDVNSDGLDDVYACQPSGLPNRLYLHQPDGTVIDNAARAGVDWMDRSLGALLIDLDNDSDPDLVLAQVSSVMLMENEGDGHFRERVLLTSIGEPGGLASADYDLDGDLDLYIVNYGAGALRGDLLDETEERRGPVPYHDANNGGPNVLLQNDGDWSFRNVTSECGLDANNRRWSFSASWEDYDNDGDSDLYVANDFGRNNLYRNDDGQFTDVAADAGVEDIAAGMSVSWADSNGDGWMDLYVGNMYSSAGGRIAYQDRFQQQAMDEIRAQYQRHARGNSLFLNSRDGRFEDVSEAAGSHSRPVAWSSNFVDINNDGLQDLVVANGFVTGRDLDDL